MVILAIETSCDETAVSIVEVTGDFPHATYTVLADALFSQVDIHREYGGVYPNIAKREHALTLVPLLEKAVSEARLQELPHSSLFPEKKEKIQNLLSREEGLADALLSFFKNYNTPDIDLIAVTHGPGLEPALWVGVNFARALSVLWDVPVIGTNHMEGHILSSIFDGKKLREPTFPALALLISGGHTELVLMKGWMDYEKVGGTRDDAVGEAFDKVARMLELPYPGGPEISKLAEYAREHNLIRDEALPRPMIDSRNLDMSFSGLKTAVLYAVKDEKLEKNEKVIMARAFEDAVTEVLLKKARDAIETYGIESVIVGGGVSANKHIRRTLTEQLADVSLYLPDPKLSTDNAIMIALAAHTKLAQKGESAYSDISLLKASGNLALERVPKEKN